MPTKDVFDLDDHLPLFLTDQRGQQVVLTDEPAQQVIVKAWGGAVIWPRVLKTTTLVATAIAITIAILSTGNPVALFADVTASVVDNSAVQPATDRSTPSVQSTVEAKALPPTAQDAPSRDEIAAAFKSALQPVTDQSTPSIQSTVDAKALPPSAKDASSRDELAAASEPAGRNQAENSELSSEALFREFQAWAAEQDAQAQVAPVPQPVQDAPAKAAANPRASLLVHKHRHVKPVHNARAEMRSAQNPRKKIRREQNARVEAPAAQEAPAQVQYVQNPFLQLFDWHN